MQVVHIADPDITSAAALALLAKKYVGLDKSIYTEFRMHRIRNKWMKHMLKTPDPMGGLTCAICGEQGLLPNHPNMNQRATLDHIVQIGLGGSWNNTENFQVACYACNNTKNSRLQREAVTA